MQLAESTGCEVIAYSRAGYGKSSPTELPRNSLYMHDEGLQLLPALIRSLNIIRPILVGHSDGASIALICSGNTKTELRGLVLMAPHINVERMAVESISTIKLEWEAGDLHQQLAKYHDDVDSAFRGWNDIWLHKDFIHWNIEEYLATIDIPILAIQGFNDEYGSMAQIDKVKTILPQTDLLKLSECGHSPHRDQSATVLDSVKRFVLKHVRNA